MKKLNKTAVLILISLITLLPSCGDNCDEGCEEIAKGELFILVNDLDEIALVTFYGDKTRSNNIVLQTNARANSNSLLYISVGENIGLLETAPFGVDITFDSSYNRNQ